MNESTPGALVLRDRFRLVRKLGQGGMGVVWEVEDAATRKHFAAKFIRGDGERIAKRVRREAEAAAATAHPNIVRVVEVVEEDDGTSAIVMELLEGESLGEHITREGKLTVGQTSAILRRVTSALRAAHAAGVVHRDMKPDNVFIAVDARGSVDVRVLDFGIAKQYGVAAESITVTGTLVGTPLYMSPEHAAGERDLDPRADVWAVAVIAFECLTGQLPVRGENYGQILARLIRGDVTRLADVAPGLPSDLIEAVDGALVPRAQRSDDFAALEAAFARHADDVIATPRIVVKSEPTLPVEPHSAEELDATQAMLPVEAPRAARRRGLGFGLIIGVSFALVPIVALLLLRFFFLQQPPRPVAATPPSSTESAAPASSVAQLNAATASAPSVEPPIGGGGAPVKPASIGPRSSPPPRVASPAPSAAASGPKRLQGGVAGDVPF